MQEFDQKSCPVCHGDGQTMDATETGMEFCGVCDGTGYADEEEERPAVVETYLRLIREGVTAWDSALSSPGSTIHFHGLGYDEALDAIEADFTMRDLVEEESVRGDWQSPYADPVFTEYRLALSHGKIWVRIIGELADDSPSSARLEWGDKGDANWVTVQLDDAEQAAILRFAKLFADE